MAHLQFDELPQFGVLLKPVLEAHVPDEVLRTLARVHKVLTVVIVGVGRLRALVTTKRTKSNSQTLPEVRKEQPRVSVNTRT